MGGQGRPRRAQDGAKMGQDEAQMGQDGPTLEAMLLMLRKNCIFQKIVFRLGGSAILGLRRAEMRPRWRYVGTQVASLGAGSELRWPMLALGRCMLALLGSASGSEGSSPPVSGPPRGPGDLRSRRLGGV